MNSYCKILNVYKRNIDKNSENYNKLIKDKFTIPEFEYLKTCNWIWTEKIDGTNIRVIYKPDETEVVFKGRTDKAVLYVPLLEKLICLFPYIEMKKMFKNTEICLYGEGFGKGINAGGNYIPAGNDFILFDVKIGKWWLKREDVESIAKQLSIKCVPVVFQDTVLHCIEYIGLGLKSTFGAFYAEGVVGKPVCELLCRNRQRLMVKIKHRDFYQGGK